MRTLTSILFVGLVLICGCTNKHYVRGRGDAGQFILQHAIAYGGRAAATNGLPAIGGDWQFVQDEYGIGMLLPVSQFQAVHDFVRDAFGPPSSSAGWSVRDFGVTIMVVKTDDHTSVGIFPPMSDEKMAQGIRELTKEVEKNTR